MDKPLRFSYDEKADVITIEGIKYAGDFFRGLGGGLQHGQLFRVVSRDAGVLVLQSPPSNTKLPPAKEVTAPAAVTSASPAPSVASAPSVSSEALRKDPK